MSQRAHSPGTVHGRLAINSDSPVLQMESTRRDGIGGMWCLWCSCSPQRVSLEQVWGTAPGRVGGGSVEQLLCVERVLFSGLSWILYSVKRARQQGGGNHCLQSMYSNRVFRSASSNLHYAKDWCLVHFKDEGKKITHSSVAVTFFSWRVSVIRKCCVCFWLKSLV